MLLNLVKGVVVYGVVVYGVVVFWCCGIMVLGIWVFGNLKMKTSGANWIPDHNLPLVIRVARSRRVAESAKYGIGCWVFGNLKMKTLGTNWYPAHNLPLVVHVARSHRVAESAKYGIGLQDQFWYFGKPMCGMPTSAHNSKSLDIHHTLSSGWSLLEGYSYFFHFIS